MVGWHHRFNGHELGQTPDVEGHDAKAETPVLWPEHMSLEVETRTPFPSPSFYSTPSPSCPTGSWNIGHVTSALQVGTGSIFSWESDELMWKDLRHWS